MDDEEFRTRLRDDMNQFATEEIETKFGTGWLNGFITCPVISMTTKPIQR
jgi:hypothetical protein